MPPQELANNYGTTEKDINLAKSPQVSKPPNGMAKTKDGFAADFKNFAEGSLPQSILVALVIGTLDYRAEGRGRNQQISSAFFSLCR